MNAIAYCENCGEERVHNKVSDQELACGKCGTRRPWPASKLVVVELADSVSAGAD